MQSSWQPPKTGARNDWFVVYVSDGRLYLHSGAFHTQKQALQQVRGIDPKAYAFKLSDGIDMVKIRLMADLADIDVGDK